MITKQIFKHLLKRHITVGLVITTMSTLLPIQPSVAQEISLREAIEYTLQQHPNLRVFSIKHQQLMGAKQSATLKPAMELELEVENFAGSGNFQSFDSAETTVALSSVIELGNQRRSRIATVDARQQSLAMEQQVQALQLVAETTRRFVDVLAAQAHRQLAQEAEVLAQTALQAAQRRVDEGASARAEALRAEAALAQAQLATMMADSEIEITQWRLAEMWAAESIAFQRASGDILQLPQSQTPQQFMDRLQHNAHVQQLASEVQMRQAELELVKTNNSTDMRWRIGVRQLQAEGENALVAGVSVPLFNSRRNSGEVLTAQAKLTEAQLQQQTLQTQLRTHLLALIAANRSDSEKARTLRSEVIPLLQQAQSDAESAYQRGFYSYLELVAARQELIQAQRQLIDSAADALRTQADIEQLTAEPLSLPNYTTESLEVRQ